MRSDLTRLSVQDARDDRQGEESFGRAFEPILRRQALASEVRRTVLVGSFLTACLLLLMTLRWVPVPLAPEVARAVASGFVRGVFVLVAGIAYEAITWAWLRRALRAGLPVRPALRYASAAVEVTLATLLVVLPVPQLDPTTMFQGDTTLLYFVLIVLSALHLDPLLCLFTAVLAAGEYLALWWVYLGGSLSPAEVPLDSFLHHLVKAGLYLMAGGAAAFLASQVRRQTAGAARSLSERDQAVGLFGQYVTPEVAEQLLRQPGQLGGEVRHVSVMFVDLRDFTAFAGRRSAAEVMAYLNALFGPMIEAVNRHKGIINKFLGDGFMAVFGAPLADGRDCQNAADAALEILAGVADRVAGGALPPTRLGVGIHAGPAMVGSVGSPRRMEYTVIGSVVNLAARIESHSRHCPQTVGAVLVSQAVWSLLPPARRASACDLGPVALRGEDRPLHLFRLA